MFCLGFSVETDEHFLIGVSRAGALPGGLEIARVAP